LAALQKKMSSTSIYDGAIKLIQQLDQFDQLEQKGDLSQSHVRARCHAVLTAMVSGMHQVGFTGSKNRMKVPASTSVTYVTFGGGSVDLGKLNKLTELGHSRASSFLALLTWLDRLDMAADYLAGCESQTEEERLNTLKATCCIPDHFDIEGWITNRFAIVDGGDVE
jgi:hypothetical protein